MYGRKNIESKSICDISDHKMRIYITDGERYKGQVVFDSKTELKYDVISYDKRLVSS